MLCLKRVDCAAVYLNKKAKHINRLQLRVKTRLKTIQKR